jgi:hypothetical protein
VPINKRFMWLSLGLSLQLATNYSFRPERVPNSCEENSSRREVP